MPIYEYHCNQCDRDMEILQDITDDPRSECPKCQSTDFHKKVSVSSFRLTGSGWYKTDFQSPCKNGPKTGDCDSCCRGS